MIRVIVVLVVTSSTCALACLWLYLNCCELVRWIDARLENIKQHTDAIHEAQTIEWELYRRLVERIEALERRGEDDGK